MPKSRSAAPPAKSMTRAKARRAQASERVYEKLVEHIMALGEMLERRRHNTYRDNIGALIYLQPGAPVPEGLIKVEYEKAPDLATGGSPTVVIPGEDPGPPEPQALAKAPVLRAAHWTGVTVFND